jgi:ferredoxin
VIKYTIEIDRTGCIACGACYSTDPSHFEPDKEEKSSVVGGETNATASSGTFEDEEIENAREAEDTCPVSVITVTEL